MSAPKPCRHPGCGKLVRDGSGYCEAHKRAKPGSFADRSRGTRKERGYATHVDHKVSKAHRGTDSEESLQAICVTCHKAKTVREKSQPRGRRA